jgi:hypothetical protein
MPLDGADPLPAPLNAGCLYILDDRRSCDCARQFGGSPYCAAHHALCHLAVGSRAEQSRISEIEDIGRFIGARVAKTALRIPPTRFMRALDARRKR